MQKPVIAAFDFDGTLSRGVSGLRFFRQLLGPWGYLRFWARHLPSLALFGLRMGDEGRMELITRAVFAGRRADDIRREAQIFLERTLPRHLIAFAMDRLRSHVREGHRCVIVSRGYEAYLRPWAIGLGIRDVIATRLEEDAGGRLTGHLAEASCDGREKCSRLLAIVGDRAGCELYAYGDGRGDHAMMAEADRAFIRGRSGFEPWRGGRRRP